ncbi:MAG TPA: DinB family protein [Caldilineaceae bacterium]|nr:DinB family protein [Caldilineaceae bacterium]
MRPLLIGCGDEIHKIFHDLDEAIAGLPTEALDWAPGAEMNSISVLAAHTAGSVRYWVSDVALGKNSTNRRREVEFQTHGLTADELRRLLQAALADVLNALEAFDDAELATPRLAPSQGNTVTAGWALAHALAHAATHLGHIQLTRQLWEQRQL